MRKIISDLGFSRKKAQLSLEFIIFIAVSMVIFVSFLYIIGERQSQIKEKRQLLSVKDLAYKIQLELDTASVVEDGYCRNFSIPLTIEGLSYDAYISNGTLTIFSPKFDVSTRIPEVKGDINITFNSIRKESGRICINTLSCP